MEYESHKSKMEFYGYQKVKNVEETKLPNWLYLLLFYLELIIFILSIILKGGLAYL